MPLLSTSATAILLADVLRPAESTQVFNGFCVYFLPPFWGHRFVARQLFCHMRLGRHQLPSVWLPYEHAKGAT